jgi:hypothetical protein
MAMPNLASVQECLKTFTDSEDFGMLRLIS